MDQLQGATPGSEPWAQANDVDLASDKEVGEALSIRITRFLRMCWVRRRMVFGILASGTLVSLLYAFSQPTVYTSKTTLMPPDSASSNSSMASLLSLGGGVASVGGAALGIRTPGAAVIAIMKSRSVQESLVKQFDLVQHYKTSTIENACMLLTASTLIREDPKSGFIDISVTVDSPVLASKIANGYIEELNSVMTHNSTSAAQRERVFLEARLKEIKQDLDDSSKTLSQFSSKSKTIDIPSQERAMVDSGIRLQDQMVVARSELAGIRQSYSEDNVRTRAARARVAELQRQIDKMMGSPEEPTLDKNNSAYPSVSELPALGLTYFDLERKVRVEEVLWDALARQYEAARVQEAKEIPTVRVLDVANVPQRKSAPARSRIVILGAILSLFAACISVFSLATWEEMAAQDEPKKLVMEIVGIMENSLRWIWCLPGMGWIHTLLNGPE